ncbi:MAG: LD-carboxypeptidase [Muribaculaceae bacterium]|nr:LD-carboxypeptidase [Muribaculaceae bacterium]
MKFPQPLKKGDLIAICSPAGPVNADYVHEAAEVLRREGWEVKIMPHTLGHNGQYSGTDEERFNDLRDALLDPEVRAVVCSRGGYGVVHLMDRLEGLPLGEDPKWVVGYSDISALHAMLNHKGVASIHGSMASHIRLGAENEDNASLFGILRGERPAYVFPSHPYDRPGIATGTFLGGNLAVLAELINTPYDLLRPDCILFIEDIAEPIYKVERIMYQLRLSGVLKNIRGLVVGQFTDYKPNENYADMETMIRDMVAPYSYPVAFGAPIGHVFHNIPVIEGAQVTLKVNPEGTDSIIFWRS